MSGRDNIEVRPLPPGHGVFKNGHLYFWYLGSKTEAEKYADALSKAQGQS